MDKRQERDKRFQGPFRDGLYNKRMRSLTGRIKGVGGGRVGSWRGTMRGVEVGGGGVRNRCVMNHNAPVLV